MAYAWPVFGLQAFDEANDGELQDAVKRTLVVKYPHPEAKEVPKQERAQARQLAEAEVWAAERVLMKLDDQKYQVFNRLVMEVLAMKYSGTGEAI
ncbi:hypothetical protein LTR36_003697 [Oleoguttula mirabilis]|uniref:Uncharacterized protein n=1 Tax=Oleoguttula mirabilis TaxID=1507867 RepID=A0AAV9JIS5_9PEZI|nr:hypothetical protein LTR36_003697 [Oleoguttula mirabilis]